MRGTELSIIKFSIYPVKLEILSQLNFLLYENVVKVQEEFLSVIGAILS